MKRKFLILSVLALCFSLFAAETIAYFTADSKAHNVITTGGVQDCGAGMGGRGENKAL